MAIELYQGWDKYRINKATKVIYLVIAEIAPCQRTSLHFEIWKNTRKTQRSSSEIAEYQMIRYLEVTYMGGFRGGTGGLDPLENYKNIGFLSNTCPDPLKNHKAIKPAFNAEPSSARQRNAIFTIRADIGPLLTVFKSSLTPKKGKKNIDRVGPPLAKLSGSAHDMKLSYRTDQK